MRKSLGGKLPPYVRGAVSEVSRTIRECGLARLPFRREHQLRQAKEADGLLNRLSGIKKIQSILL